GGSSRLRACGGYGETGDTNTADHPFAARPITGPTSSVGTASTTKATGTGRAATATRYRRYRYQGTGLAKGVFYLTPQCRRNFAGAPEKHGAGRAGQRRCGGNSVARELARLAERSLSWPERRRCAPGYLHASLL